MGFSVFGACKALGAGFRGLDAMKTEEIVDPQLLPSKRWLVA